MPSRWTNPFLLAAALTCAATARPQTPQPPQPPQPVSDAFFPGIERFEKNATRVTRVESDRSHDRRDDNTAPGSPKHLSTVYVFGYDHPGLYNPADVDVYRRKLHTPEWNCQNCEGRLKPGEAFDACTRTLNSSTVESVVIDMRLDKLTFIHTVGRPSSNGNSTVCHED